MKQKILTLFILFSLTLSIIPFNAKANTAIEIFDQDFQNISISVSGSVLRIEGAENETLQIYNVTGVRVVSIRIDGNDKRYNLNLPKGCYIVKVGKVVRKISIRQTHRNLFIFIGSDALSTLYTIRERRAFSLNNNKAI